MLVGGRVRRFNAERGFGFVKPEDGGGDIFLHVTALQAFGVPFVTEGTWVLVRVETRERGRVAVEVVEVRSPPAPPPAANAGPLEPARVRWFNREVGYGFVNAPGPAKPDVYLHMDTLRRCGFGAVKEGEAILVRVTMTPLGPAVCEVRPWDYDRTRPEPSGRLRR
jgi:CspA family cold shock protein